MDMINFWNEGFIPKQDNKPYNQTVYWSGSDNLESFRKNPRPEYTETSITYSYNSFGFREEEFNLDNGRNNILCLGCSHTEGIGLPLEHVWVSHLKLQYPLSNVYNLGNASGAADTVARILTNTSSVFKPTDVFIFWPSMNRYEVCQVPSTIQVNATWNMSGHNMYMLDELQSYNNFTKNRLIVQLLQEKYKFNLYELEDDNMPKSFKEHEVYSRARDNHYGPSRHKKIFNYFMEQVNANTTI